MDRQAPTLVRSFSKVGQYKAALLSLSLIDLMAATLQMVVYPPSHAPHPVVPEVPLELHNPRVAAPTPCHQGSGPSTSVVISRGAPFTKNALFVTQCHHHHYYGCEHGGLGWRLSSARVDHGTLQRPLVQVVFRASSSLTDPPPSGAGDSRQDSPDRVRQYNHGVVHQ